MADLTERARTRILPALLTAFGVTLLAAGLLSYTTPVAAGPGPVATLAPIASASGTPTPAPLITLPPINAASPSASASADPDRVATRVRIAALDIDLPVVEGPSGYPYCNVAMYLDAPNLGQPGQGRATYLFAHARTGMFLPLLETPGKKQVGMIVEVWTSDDQRFLYEVTEVRRKQLDLDDAAAADHEQLWLQTSEGPRGTAGKTQVVAELLSVEPASHAEANPTPDIVHCS
jgi:sortase (surface protein transpeptidase)